MHFKYERRTQDHTKDKLLDELGIRVIRISTLDMEEDYESIVVHLEDLFQKRAKELLEE